MGFPQLNGLPEERSLAGEADENRSTMRVRKSQNGQF